MSSYIINVEKAKNRKTSKEFSSQDKKALFDFLGSYPDSEEALNFVLNWFNCSRMTLVKLELERSGTF